MFVRKFNGKTERADREERIVAVYCCPEHGEFDAEVMRDANGEAPDSIACKSTCPPCCRCIETGEPCPYTTGTCGELAHWTPSPVAARVRRVEAVKGKWQKPERETYLDTRELGEGMDMDEFQAKRAAIWEKKRQEDVMQVKKGFG